MKSLYESILDDEEDIINQAEETATEIAEANKKDDENLDKYTKAITDFYVKKGFKYVGTYSGGVYNDKGNKDIHHAYESRGLEYDVYEISEQDCRKLLNSAASKHEQLVLSDIARYINKNATRPLTDVAKRCGIPICKEQYPIGTTWGCFAKAGTYPYPQRRMNYFPRVLNNDRYRRASCITVVNITMIDGISYEGSKIKEGVNIFRLFILKSRIKDIKV